MLGNGFVLNVVVQALPGMAVVALGLALSLMRVAAGRWARLAAAGFGLLLAQDVLWLSVNSWFSLGSSRFSGAYRLLGLVGWLGTLLSAAGLLLLLLAVFSARGAWGADRPSGSNGWQPGYGPQAGYGQQAGFGAPSGYGPQAGHGQQAGFGAPSGFGPQAGPPPQGDAAAPQPAAPPQQPPPAH